MTTEEKVAKELIRRSQECERGVLAIGVSERNPDMGFGIALVAPNSLLFSFTPGPGFIFDLHLN